MAQDVTGFFETYRECARHLRNTYFATHDSQDWDAIEDFDAVAKVLFQRLVLWKIDDEADDLMTANKLLIIPSAQRVPVMISREQHGGGYWDHPVTYLAPGDARIAFRDYFDWDQHALIDFRYYRGFVLDSSKYPDITKHEVLIETIYGNVLYEATPVA